LVEKILWLDFMGECDEAPYKGWKRNREGV